MKSTHLYLLILTYVAVAVFAVVAIAMFIYWRHLLTQGYDKLDMREVYSAYAGDYLE